jgi:hypothetical protein
MNRKATWLAAGAAAAIAVIAVAVPTAASAASAPALTSACDAEIADSTPSHVLGTSTAVAQAAAQLKAKGADVRVRVLATAPDGSLDAYEQTEISGCASWSLNGTIKPNLLVILVSLDHQDAIFYGANFSRLQGQVDQIRADMGSDFKAGNFDAGIAKGETETYSALYPSGPSALDDAFTVLGVVVILGVAIGLIRRSRGSLSSGSGPASHTVFIGGASGFGGGSSDGGSSGGSSGSW